MLFLFMRNSVTCQVLKAGTWSSQSTFLALYLRDVTHRHKDTFSIGTAVAAQEVVKLIAPSALVNNSRCNLSMAVCDYGHLDLHVQCVISSPSSVLRQK